MGTIGSGEFNNRRLLAFQPSFSFSFQSLSERESDASPSSGGFLLLLLSLLGISSRFQLLFPSQGQVLTRYSPVRHWKHHFSSDLHVLSMPPTFILSQDRTLHEILSCITCSFLVRRHIRFHEEIQYINTQIFIFFFL